MKCYRSLPTRAVLLLVATSACAVAHQPAPQQAPPQKPRYGETVWADFGDSCPASVPGRPVPEAWLDSLAAMRAGSKLKLPNRDEEAAARSRSIPGGFGGLFFPNGKPEIFLVDTMQRSAAIAAVVSLYHPQAPYNQPLDTSKVRARRIRWDYDTLNTWYIYLRMHGIWEAGANMSDIREEENRIEFGVLNDVARGKVLQRLRELDVPCQLVMLVVRPTAVAGSEKIPL